MKFAAARVVLGVIVAAEVETVLEEGDLASEIGQAGVTAIAQGAAVLGAAESAGSGK